MPRTPPCPYFAECGGCSSQDLTYGEQLEGKRSLLGRIFGFDVEVHGAPKEFGYRSRMDFLISSEGLCLRRKGRSFAAVPVERCLLVSDEANAVLAKAREAILSSGLPAYDLRTHSGLLRYLTLREDASGSFMLVLTTAEPDDEGGVRSLLSSLHAFSQSAYWVVHAGKGDDVSGEVRACLGEESLSEELLGLSFSVYPSTFFQSNRAVAQRMFSVIRDLVSGRLLDLYCGVGAISLIAASSCASVVGVEANADSIRSARENASSNGVSSVSFLVSSVDAFVAEAARAKERFDTIVVDPPRTGLGPVVARGLPLLGASRIVYMSCNPRTLRDDLPLLSGYRLVSLEGFDMFPQTDHVECLAVLERE